MLKQILSSPQSTVVHQLCALTFVLQGRAQLILYTMSKCLGEYSRYRWVRHNETWPGTKQLGKKACRQHGHTVEVVGSRLYVIGGSSASIPVRLYCFDQRERRWRDLSLNGSQVPQRNFIYHSSTLASDSIFVLCEKLSHRLWKFDVTLEEWQRCDCNSDSVEADVFMALEFMEHRNECIQIGGVIGIDTPIDDINALRLDDMRWYKPEVKGRRPAAFSNMASCVVGKTIYTFGGNTIAGALLREINLLHCVGHGVVSWSSPEVLGSKPQGRENSTITNLFCGKLLVVGGFDGDFYSDMWLYSIPDKKWTDLSGTNACEGRIPRISQHRAVYFGNKLMIIGGHDHSLVDGYAVLEGIS